MRSFKLDVFEGFVGRWLMIFKLTLERPKMCRRGLWAVIRSKTREPVTQFKSVKFHLILFLISHLFSQHYIARREAYLWTECESVARKWQSTPGGPVASVDDTWKHQHYEGIDAGANVSAQDQPDWIYTVRNLTYSGIFQKQSFPYEISGWILLKWKITIWLYPGWKKSYDDGSPSGKREEDIATLAQLFGRNHR